VSHLHNMSVPPRSILTVERASLAGRRIRVTLTPGAGGCSPPELTALFRQHGSACAVALLLAGHAWPPLAELESRIASISGDAKLLADARAECLRSIEPLRLPAIGFFADEAPQRAIETLSRVQAIGVLAARSGPLYLHGRFEPSLISATVTTLFFPASTNGARDPEEAR
jgi:hypothetical protein